MKQPIRKGILQEKLDNIRGAVTMGMENNFIMIL